MDHSSFAYSGQTDNMGIVSVTATYLLHVLTGQNFNLTCDFTILIKVQDHCFQHTPAFYAPINAMPNYH